MIYADNAATTKLDTEAFEAMKPYLLSEYGNASQPYHFSRSAKRALKEARKMVADCIGALPEEIYFTSGGTESNNWAVNSMISFGGQCEILASQVEHHAILNTCDIMRKFGCSARYVPVDKYGIVKADTLEEYISEKTKLVSIMTANNEIGTIEPIKELADIAHKKGVLFHTDAVQAVGHIPINVHELGVDMLSASGHKFNAPKGIGFLYIRKGVDICPYLNGGAQENGKRAGTENIASIVAMAVALKKNCSLMPENAKKLAHMENTVIYILNESKVEYIRNGAFRRIPGNISLSFKGISGEMILHRMDLKKICISTGAACNGKDTEVSHVIKAIKVPSEYNQGTIRISLGCYNTNTEAEIIAESIVDIVKHR